MTTQARNTALLGMGTICSRILGFARDMVIAVLLGPGADALLIALRIPNIFRRLVGEGSIGMAYGAVTGRIRSGRSNSDRTSPADGDLAANRFGAAVILRLLVYSFLLTLVLALCAYPLVSLLAPGASPHLWERAACLSRLSLLYLPFALTAGIVFAHAADFGSFGPQAWSPFLLNCIIIGTGLTALGAGISHGATEVLLCSSFALGGAAQLVFGILAGTAGLRSALIPELPEIKKRLAKILALTGASSIQGTDRIPNAGQDLGPDALITRDANQFLRTLPVSALGAMPHQLHILAGVVLASFLGSGGITSLYFAERLMELPLGIAGAAIGMASLPSLARLAGKSDYSDFFTELGCGLRLSAFLSLPATAGLLCLGHPLSFILFGHGANTEHSVLMTSAALTGFAVGLPALCASRPLLAACYALGLRSLPITTALISLVPVVCLPLAPVVFGSMENPAGTTGALWISLGLSAGSWCNTLLLYRAMKKAGMVVPASLIRTVLSYAAAALCMAAALYLLSGLVHGSVARLLALIAVCAATWFGGFFLARNPDARAFAALITG